MDSPILCVTRCHVCELVCEQLFQMHRKLSQLTTQIKSLPFVEDRYTELGTPKRWIESLENEKSWFHLLKSIRTKKVPSELLILENIFLVFGLRKGVVFR
eukprot:TRINITY_DN6590_c0_g1_i15.p1 TRINITY_DN6590_c0_g1~~TRINITY_DN6590_c0_g1_i15.p1  ORF type:complete len:100 (+),score=12.55 TRINITY_DN6590_c0_g1_i15:80-379(+)